jgi:hypothetical protein
LHVSHIVISFKTEINSEINGSTSTLKGSGGQNLEGKLRYGNKIPFAFLLGAHKLFVAFFLDFSHLVTKEQKSFHTFAPLLRAAILCRRASGSEGEDTYDKKSSGNYGRSLLKDLFIGEPSKWQHITFF